jgi:hypothetical protein
LHTNLREQSQKDEQIQNYIDFSTIKPKMKSRRWGAPAAKLPIDIPAQI